MIWQTDWQAIVIAQVMRNGFCNSQLYNETFHRNTIIAPKLAYQVTDTQASRHLASTYI